MAGSQVHLASHGQSPSLSDVNLHSAQNVRGYQNVPAQPSPGFTPPSAFKENMDYDTERNWDAMRESDAILKKRIRQARLILRICTLILAMYMTATMIVTIHKYLSTRHIIIGGRNAWAKQTTTWPTILLLVTSAITLIINAVVVVAYFRSVKAANKTHDFTVYIASGVFLAHMGMWIATAILYRTGKTGHDLWGWTCDPKAEKIQPQFAEVVRFERYCSIQTSSWATSLAEAALTVLAVLVYYLGYRRLRQKRILQKYAGEEVRESRWTKMVPTRMPEYGVEGGHGGEGVNGGGSGSGKKGRGGKFKVARLIPWGRR